jgi:peptidoglycan/xylan/chitin deacetylase (PgdA/CDA1 family)
MMNNIPILLYHDFCAETDRSKNNFAVTWGSFKAQMDWLHQNGYAVVSLAKLLAELEYWKGDGRGLPAGQAGTKDEVPMRDTRKKVVLTFDDGDISNYHFALPLLKEKGFTGTFFITVNEIGKPGRMDWSMVYELAKNGMDVGSHSMTHTFLTGMSNYALLSELMLSKQILEKYIRKRVGFLSIPHGFYSPQVLDIARDVGFRAACVSDAGYNDFTDKDAFLLKRFTMRRSYDLGAFRSIVTGAPKISVLALEGARTFLRKTLGAQVYDKLRTLRYRSERDKDKE